MSNYGKRAKTSNAKPAVVKFADRNRLGQPVGKELAEVSFVDLFNKGNGAIMAKFEKSFGEYKMPMGVECMADEVIICNMNNGTVEFTDFDGTVSLTLPKEAQGGPKTFDAPALATLLLDGRIICGDKRGIHVYDSDGVFIKTVKPATQGQVYGVIPLRENNGTMLVICVEDNGETTKFVLYDKDFNNVIKTNKVDFPEAGRKTIRFSAGLGNTIALSDMNRFTQGIWLCDTEGNIRRKVGDTQGENDGQFVQAAGVCFDKDGNFLAICSKSSRIMAFRDDGEYLCSIQFPEGAIQRPSALAINDNNDMSVVSLTGQCFMFKLQPGDSTKDYPTRGPRPERGYHVLGRNNRGGSRGRGRGRERGGRGAGRGGGRGRGGDRGGFRPRY
ncbi:Oidioi.mRNA.OKI2018_I69.chr1.g3851.t1.cds [Oikopleura dioica]|uniref:Oidioi.mRNA.OKI2018_I69.chr1.g3851.t1.cds n=1 Tax=Oikopleura dioica TaxID=34765 RepID=A0ABN7SVZ1_OIKDI|nr:Oidioi.mRNA.OKI2018_I69.chr1.g3851.t1.cds [Oikopleura dioica]